MRSLLISSSYFPPQVGGISTMMAEICKELGEHQVAVLTGVEGQAEAARIGHVRVHKMSGGLDPHSIPRTIRLIASVGLALAKERPAVLQYATLEDAYLAYWTRRALRIPHVMYSHGNELLAAGKSVWKKPRVALLSASCVVANSRYTARLLKDLQVPAERIRVVHPGCDLECFRPLQVTGEERARILRGRANGCRILLTVGNLVERKGHDTVIRALSLLPNGRDDVVYLIAGDGPNRGALERLCASLGVSDRVVFLGRVAESELPLLYSAADIFMMVSRERPEHCDVEGFGIVFIEAAACGTPAIGGRSGGVEDAVVDGVTGLLVDPLDVAQVARSIDTLLADRGLARRLGGAARDRAVSQFSWSRFGRTVASILTDVASQRALLRGVR